MASETTLTCDSCGATADGIRPAVDHAMENPGHTLTLKDEEHGFSVKVGTADDDGWYTAEYEDDDWNAADQ